MANSKPSVLLIYTGGTIGMMQDARTGELKPFNFKALSKQIPELEKFDIELSSISFKHPIDSSNMHPRVWIEIAEIVKNNYQKHDGFVILHGSDTMSYTASALSFMLENLAKPVILTGSQLPIGIIRTDGKENLITAIEIAAAFS
jgi:L-asparaginase